jgi:protein-disulfide isomerase-like protein with CxxC motif
LAVLVGFVSSGCDGDGLAGPQAASLPDLFGDQLFRADGSPVGVGTLNDTAIIGIYFADPGCPACAGFTPILVNAYDQWREEGHSFEVVLVTPGISEASMFDYMAEFGMSWLAVSPQGNRSAALANRYNIRWVPTLVIIDGAGNTISLRGREELAQSGAGAYDAWLTASGGS